MTALYYIDNAMILLFSIGMPMFMIAFASVLSGNIDGYTKRKQWICEWSLGIGTILIILAFICLFILAIFDYK